MEKVGNFFDKVGQTLDAIIMTFSIEGGVGMGFGIEGKAGLLSFYFGGHGNLFYFKAGGDEDYPFGMEREVGFGISIGNYNLGFNFSEEYEPYGGEGFESSTNETKEFFGIGAGIYLGFGGEFSIGWDLIELKDRLEKIWG